MSRIPQVLQSSPKNYETDVGINSSLSAEFNIDLDSRYVNKFVYLQDNDGKRIEGRVSYKKKRIVFMPYEPLEQGTTYQFVLLGDSNLEDGEVTGLRSILGDAMRGNTVVHFTTEVDQTLPAPTGISPTNDSVIRQVPTFEWSAVEGASAYEIEISRSNRFDTVVYPVASDTHIYETSIDPNINWGDGIYYWRVRTIRADNQASQWSPSYQFNLDTTEEGTIANEDTHSVELFYEDADIELELVEQFPKDLEINVPTNIKSLYFRVIGSIDTSLLDVDSFMVKGEHITEDELENSHGDVGGQFAIVNDTDGTTYIIFTPDVLETVGES